MLTSRIPVTGSRIKRPQHDRYMLTNVRGKYQVIYSNLLELPFGDKVNQKSCSIQVLSREQTGSLEDNRKLAANAH